KYAPEVKQEDQERRMGNAQASLIGQPPRGRVRRAKMQGFIRIKKSSVRDPETQQKCAYDDNCSNEIRPSFEPIVDSCRFALRAGLGSGASFKGGRVCH